ncbi:unnamed protein product [Adineta steineri]|uniref:SH3 domain-containing protein n=1 Tax=Adineta steineri TaxID=433720 RepID=A0A818M404_9BILA|nr:unnamed protein product [Adineta steineri]CAF3589108.1 unnamed protein product [Adineta steineri]
MKKVSQMYENEGNEYTNRHKMEETTAKVFACLHKMKNTFYKTMKKTSCVIRSNRNRTSDLPINYHCDKNSKITKSLIDIRSDDTISSISEHSTDSGLSTLSNSSHYSLPSSTLLFNRTKQLESSHLRCNPSIINYISHNLLTNDYSELFFDEMPLLEYIPLAESSRQILYENEEYDQTIICTDDDEQNGPLTSTLIDGWYSIIKPYSAIFRQDLTVRKNEFVQILHSTHPHWIWIRNEQSYEGFIPTDCLFVS